MIRDAAVCMRIAFGNVVAEVGRLRRQAVSRAGLGEIAQAGVSLLQCDGAEDTRADQPVRLCNSLLAPPLMKYRAEHVQDTHVESAGLVGVVQARGELGDTVGQLVADDVIRFGEVSEDLTVAVPVGHLGAIPEGVVVAHTVVNRRHQCHAGIVNRVAAKAFPVEINHGVGRIERAFRRHVRLSPGFATGEPGSDWVFLQS